MERTLGELESDPEFAVAHLAPPCDADGRPAEAAATTSRD